MNRQLLLGAEAVAQGAIDAGITGVYAYPGTPSTEITEYIQRSPDACAAGIRSSWSSNEKTACEAALGMSYAGRRSLACMKHVGLNVAADAFINAAITGVNGGLVLAVADDPSMHSSQNEQDSRVYGKFAMVPVIEPSSQQELYDSMFHAFDLSESVQLPVLLRITTRLSHSRAGVERKTARSQNPLHAHYAPERFVLMPHNARRQYLHLLDLQPRLEKLSESSFLNRSVEGVSTLGVLACGIGYNYVMEARQTHGIGCPVLKIGQYPLPRTQVNDLFASCSTVLVVEEGYPVYEELLRGYFGNDAIMGRMDGTLPRTGELTTDLASITMAKGAADAGLRPAVAVIGDSTFAHSGMTGLLDAVNDRSPVTVIIADNDTTAMTGGQTSAASGTKIEEICRGLGVDEHHIRTIIPLKSHLQENIAVLREETGFDGVSVVIARRECIESAAKKKRKPGREGQ